MPAKFVDVDFIRLEKDGLISIYFKDYTCIKVPKEKVHDFTESLSAEEEIQKMINEYDIKINDARVQRNTTAITINIALKEVLEESLTRIKKNGGM